VSAVVKHFPGGGAQLDGEDPHVEYGREQVHPGGHLETVPTVVAIHLERPAVIPEIAEQAAALPDVLFGHARAEGRLRSSSPVPWTRSATAARTSRRKARTRSPSSATS